MAIFSSASYSAVLESVDEAIAWLQELGVSCTVNRVAEYKRALRTLADASDRSAVLQKHLSEVNAAIFETYELIEIYKTLSGRYDEKIKEQINAVTSGPLMYSTENSGSSSNRARNVAFELAVMSLLVRANLELEFGSLADAVAKLENRTIFFECKRPQNLSAVERRVKDAIGQLKIRINGAQKVRQRGIVAIDITKALNPEFNVYVTKSEAGINASLDAQVDAFVQRQLPWLSKIKGGQAIGVLFRVRQMNIVEYEGYAKLFHAQQIALCPFKGTGLLNEQTLITLKDRLLSSFELRL